MIRDMVKMRSVLKMTQEAINSVRTLHAAAMVSPYPAMFTRTAGMVVDKTASRLQSRHNSRMADFDMALEV